MPEARRSALGHWRWAWAGVLIAAVLVGLAHPALSQGGVRATHYCGTTTKGDGFYLEAGGKPRPTSCAFARATYRAYWKWGLKHAGGHAHFQLLVARHRLACNRGVHEAEVGESVFEVRCHGGFRFVEMSVELGS